MNLVLLYVSGQKEPFADQAEELFVAKIKNIFPFEVLKLKAHSAPRDSAENKKQKESEKILATLKTDDFVVALDEAGKLPKDSRDFSRWVVRAIESGKRRVVFVIGGPFGLTTAVQERADLAVSLSSLTFNHHVAKVVVMEQIYRALSIWRNRPYHND